MAGKGKIHGEITRNSTNDVQCWRNSSELLVAVFRTQNKYFVLQTLLLVVDVERRFIDCSSVRSKVVITNSTQHQSAVSVPMCFFSLVVKFHWSPFP